MRKLGLAGVYLVLVLVAAAAFSAPPELPGPAPAVAAHGRFQLAILPQSWYELGMHYDWEGVWPLLQAAAAKPLLVIDERDVEAYDWAAQRIVLRSAATPRFLPILQTLAPESERRGLLKALWDGDNLVFLEDQGFLVSLDGQPLYGGLFLDKASQMSISYPVLYVAMDEERRIVLRFSPLHYPFGSLWNDGTSGDALEAPGSLSVTEVQSAFQQAFPEVRTPDDYLSPADRELVARFKQRILDPRVEALFTQLGVPAHAPRHPAESAASVESAEGAGTAKPFVALNPVLGRGWEILVDLDDPKSVAEIRLRSGEETAWHRLAPDKSLTRLKARPEWLTPGRHRIEVKLVDAGGVESAPYTDWFDPEQARLLLAKDELRQTMYRWAQFSTDSKYGGPCLDFATAFRHRDALREIRYSFGDCAVDRRFPFAPWTNLAEPATVEWEDKTAVPVTPEISRACVQLVYLDGEVTEPQVYDRFPSRENVWRLAADPGAAAPPAASPGSASPVSLRTRRYDTGWEMAFDLDAPETLRDILYRFDGDAKWLSTGLSPRRSPRTGLCHPNTGVPVSPRLATPGRHRLDVRLVALDGREKGPYTFWFDPQQQVLAEAKSTLNDPNTAFVTFGESGLNSDNITLYFSGLIDHRDALREIRYSIGSKALDKRLPFTPWDDLVHNPTPDAYAFFHFQNFVSSACFQLVYRDGETAEPRCFVHQRKDHDER